MENNYQLEHTGDGKFKATFENGEIKEAGTNLRGMIRFTYFEDYTIPEVGWKVESKQLLLDYHAKVLDYFQKGKLKKGEDGIIENGF